MLGIQIFQAPAYSPERRLARFHQWKINRPSSVTATDERSPIVQTKIQMLTCSDIQSIENSLGISLPREFVSLHLSPDSNVSNSLWGNELWDTATHIVEMNNWIRSEPEFAHSMPPGLWVFGDSGDGDFFALNASGSVLSLDPDSDEGWQFEGESLREFVNGLSTPTDSGQHSDSKSHSESSVSRIVGFLLVITLWFLSHYQYDLDNDDYQPSSDPSMEELRHLQKEINLTLENIRKAEQEDRYNNRELHREIAPLVIQRADSESIDRLPQN